MYSTENNHEFVMCNHDFCFVPSSGGVFVKSNLPPTKMMFCKCGRNAFCPSCGYGWGASPCEHSQGIIYGASLPDQKETQMNIDKLQAGRELDALVAEKVMGYEWRRFKAAHSRRIVRKLCKPGAWIFENREQANGDEPLASGWSSGVLHFSRNLISAMKVLKHIDTLYQITGSRNDVIVRLTAREGEQTVDVFGYGNGWDDLPLAICRAALKAAMEQ